MQRQCVCGAKIKTNRQLCGQCAEIYGLKREEWAGWLLEWMRMYERELVYESKVARYECEFTDSDLDIEDYLWANQ